MSRLGCCSKSRQSGSVVICAEHVVEPAALDAQRSRTRQPRLRSQIGDLADDRVAAAREDHQRVALAVVHGSTAATPGSAAERGGGGHPRPAPPAGSMRTAL